jgi:hypothetical protein
MILIVSSLSRISIVSSLSSPSPSARTVMSLVACPCPCPLSSGFSGHRFSWCCLDADFWPTVEECSEQCARTGGTQTTTIPATNTCWNLQTCCHLQSGYYSMGISHTSCWRGRDSLENIIYIDLAKELWWMEYDDVYGGWSMMMCMISYLR